MHTETLPKNTKEILEKLSSQKFIKKFYLSGGTALALQIGHRESVDLDFFSNEEFDTRILQVNLEKLGDLKDIQIDTGTLNCFIDGTQLQFLHYPCKLLEEKIAWNGIFLSSTLDIACTKLITVSARGSKKDFIDMHFLLQKYDLKFLLQKLKEKYADADYNTPHILKSLAYFEDANNQPTPKMHVDVKWEEVKNDILTKIKSSNTI